MKLSVIDWRITSKCNNNCDFCYGSKGVSTSQDVDKIIDCIKESNCEAVCITGGEPLLDDNVYHIIERLHNIGVAVYLSTNGAEYLANRERIEPYISKLSLPLDGYDQDSNTINGRKTDSFNVVKEILDYYEIHNPKFRIKIGTVLTKKNMFQEHFEKLFDFLSNYSVIKKWKIFELIPEGNGAILSKQEGYSSEAYSNMQRRIEKYVTESGVDYSFDIDFSRRQSRNGAYFIIVPDGKVIIPLDRTEFVEEKILGDTLHDDLNSIISNWENNCNRINCFTNFENRVTAQSIIPNQIDDIDKKILYYYDKDPLELQDSLEHTLYLKEKIVISREEIDKRIKHLYKIRAIDHVMPLINIANYNLNLFLCNLYFKIEMKNQVEYISSFLKYNENISWVAECYDWQNDDKYIIFRIAVYAKNNAQMSEILQEICEYFNTSLYKWEMDFVPDKNVVRSLGSTGKHIDKLSDNTFVNHHIRLEFTGEKKLTKNQYRFFLFPQDRPYNLSNLAKHMDMTEHQVRKLIDNLIEKNIIQKFQAVYNHKVLGYQWYKFFIKFSNPNDKILFEQDILHYSCVTHTNTLTQGTWDMDFEIQVKSSSMAFNFWNKIKNQYNNQLSNESIIRMNTEYKFDFLPPVVLNAMGKNVKKFF